jgi:steroid 5-alpha reductase family enzyme
LLLITVYTIALGVILGLVTILWLVSLRLSNSSIIDIFWGAGFVIANGVYFALTPDGFLGRKWLIGALLTIWGLRLSLHILLRNWGKPEDFRYQKWRRQAGSAWAWQSFYRVFLLQGVLMWVISAPLLASQFAGQPAHLTVFDLLGAVVWLVGFFFEAVGDAQLAGFKSNPARKGQILAQGVWRYTRHPNYFGDAAQWWGFFLIAAAAGGGWTIFSPILMTLLLLRVSGVALLEKTLETRPGYQEYIQKTSAFIPWFPRDL